MICLGSQAALSFIIKNLLDSSFEKGPKVPSNSVIYIYKGVAVHHLVLGSLGYSE